MSSIGSYLSRNRGKPVVEVRFAGSRCRSDILLLGIHVEGISGVVVGGVFEPESGDELQAVAELLVVTQVGGVDGLVAGVVLGLLHRVACAVELRGVRKVEAREVLIADEIPDGVVSGVEVLACGVVGACQRSWPER